MHLINNDLNTSGIFRCRLVKDGDKVRAIIPGVYSKIPFNENGELIGDADLSSYPEVQWCCYNIESKDINNIDKLAFVMFENGNINKPVCISYAVIGGSDGSTGQYTAGQYFKNPSELPQHINEDDLPEGEWVLMSDKFIVTHYCCERYPHICNAGPPYLTKSGTTPTPGRTIAINEDAFPYGVCTIPSDEKNRKSPYGAVVKLNDHVYIAEDTGGAKDSNYYWIDVVVNTHDEAMSAGLLENQSAYVYVLPDGTMYKYNSPGGNIDKLKSKILFIGDSRTVGMFNNPTFNKGGYDVSSDATIGIGISKLDNYRNGSVDLKDYTHIVILLGINDYNSDYATAINEVVKQYSSISVTFVSILPVDTDLMIKSGYNGISNDDLKKVNKDINSKLVGCKYIDIFDTIKGKLNSKTTGDGLHYVDSLYQEIYDMIMKRL